MTAKDVLLVVEDDPEQRAQLAGFLGTIGVEVRAAATAEEARVALDEGGIDVVLTDLRLPGDGGMDLLRWARARHPGTDFLVMTAYTTLKPVTRSKFIADLGADNLPLVQFAFGLVVGFVMQAYATGFRRFGFCPRRARKRDLVSARFARSMPQTSKPAVPRTPSAAPKRTAARLVSPVCSANAARPSIPRGIVALLSNATALWRPSSNCCAAASVSPSRR